MDVPIHYKDQWTTLMLLVEVLVSWDEAMRLIKLSPDKWWHFDWFYYQILPQSSSSTANWNKWLKTFYFDFWLVCVCMWGGREKLKCQWHTCIRTNHHSTLCTCMWGVEEATIDMLTIVHLHHTKYIPYNVAFSLLPVLHKLSGSTGMLVDYLWLASSLI